PAALVARERAARDDARQLEHVPELFHEGRLLIQPAAAIVQSDAPPTVFELDDLVLGAAKILVVALDGDVLGHPLAELAPERVRVLAAVHAIDALVDVGLALAFVLDGAVAADVGRRAPESFRVGEHLRAAHHAAI